MNRMHRAWRALQDRPLLLAQLCGEPQPRVPLTRPQQAADLLLPRIETPLQEELFAIALDHGHVPVGIECLTRGGSTLTVVCPVTILRWALRQEGGVSAIIIAHTHPSCDPTPSSMDIAVTRRMEDAARAVNVPLLDHIVLSRCGRFESLSELGHIVQQRHQLNYTG